ncbi:glycosyltransferase [Segetibacter sp. 3557_3]|uniref:glycosyltransferase family 4 protein n=1 Tax=Segetibacter sp. 3557_3 TaxID=2547429 RepID=UPI001058AAA9|nr:glycosyltransferase family 4 protein [Segetibacter sp. 3557_3]TDH24639.1 glycosyltransferase [Segetibacter sp. 3557_3]
MKVIIYHPQGNNNVRESALGLAEAGLLHEFHTSIACFPGSLLDRIGSIPYLSEIRRRKLDVCLKPFTKTSPIFELGRVLSLKAGIKQLLRDETGIFSIDAVTKKLDKKVAAIVKKSNKKLLSVYAYEDGAYSTFMEAKRRGLTCFYDLPTGYWRAKLAILDEESKLFPNWKNTMPGLTNSIKKLNIKDEEIKLADRIFVASQFTKTTLQQFPGKLPKIQIIPYGFPPVGSPKNYIKTAKGCPLKLLFVGSLSQQKGIANLFEAVDSLVPEVSLTVIGSKPTFDCSILDVELSKHRWIPTLPNQQILQEMRDHDILVFPSVFDGFGLVITEAMSQGTPVIATYNCAGPDLIENGKNGWLVPAGSTDALRDKILELLKSPSSIECVGIEARETARQRPWKAYREELSKALRNNH